MMGRVALGLLLFSLLLSPLQLSAQTFTVSDGGEAEITVRVTPAAGDLLLIWLDDHDSVRPPFEAVLQQVVASGVELWRLDLLADYFLPRAGESERTLTGAGVAAVLERALQQSNKRILLAAYDRMPLALLRGLVQWRQQGGDSDRVAGAILFYPNLFGPAPIAGEEPELDPILQSPNLPLLILQPQRGGQRWRIDTVLQAFWQAGTPAVADLVEGVRDWYFMMPISDPFQQVAVAQIPSQIHRYSRLLAQLPRPAPLTATPLTTTPPPSPPKVRELVELAEPKQLPNIRLPDLHSGQVVDLSASRGKVVLLNFWASWCPPCVEEIPSIHALQQQFNSTELVVLSVDYQESEAAIRPFLAKVKVDFPVLLDSEGQVARQWHIFSLPSSFLLDRQGRVRYGVNRAIDWSDPAVVAVVRQLVAESAP